MFTWSPLQVCRSEPHMPAWVILRMMAPRFGVWKVEFPDFKRFIVRGVNDNSSSIGHVKPPAQSLDSCGKAFYHSGETHRVRGFDTARAVPPRRSVVSEYTYGVELPPLGPAILERR